VLTRKGHRELLGVPEILCLKMNDNTGVIHNKNLLSPMLRICAFGCMKLFVSKISINLKLGWGCSSVVEHLPSMSEMLGSISPQNHIQKTASNLKKK
jgi:hypothetical protein